jgi:hypothetical protein
MTKDKKTYSASSPRQAASENVTDRPMFEAKIETEEGIVITVSGREQQLVKLVAGAGVKELNRVVGD